MKIQSAKVFVCSPDRNFVTLRIETHAGVYGLGDATLNGRELAVAAYLEEHVLPCLIGVFNSLWDAKELIERQWIDHIRMTIVHGGGISHARKVADLAAIYGVRTGYHGATDLSPVAMAAALHLGLAVHNFGIQEHMPHTALTDEVFPHAYGFKTGFMHPGDKPGLGVEFDEKLAAKHPYQRAYLPIARKFDGTLTDW